MSRPKLPRDEQGNIIRTKSSELETFVDPEGFKKANESLVSDEKVLEQFPYTVNLTIGKDIYSISAPTILEALKEIHPTSFQAIASITVEHKDKVSQMPFKIFPNKLKSTLAKGWELALLAKRLTTLM